MENRNKNSSINYLNNFLVSKGKDIQNLSLRDKAEMYCEIKGINPINLKPSVTHFLKKEYEEVVCDKNSIQYKVSKEYNKYISSYSWRLIRKKVLEDRNHTCEKCGLMPEAKLLHVHHKTYERLFNEELSDLELLCKNCHYKTHNNKKIKKSKAKNSLYSLNKQKIEICNEMLM